MTQMSQLAAILHPLSSRERALLAVIAYFDESGAHGGPDDVLTVGGFLAEQDRWERIERRWDRLLGHRVFHMVDFEGHHGEFKNWPSEKRRGPLLSSLADIVLGNVVFGIADSVVLSEFRRACCPPAAKHKHVLRLAYAFLLRSCVEEIVARIKPPPGETISVVCEEHGGVEGMATDTFYAFKHRRGAERVLGGITFQPKRGFRGLQAADLVAYENFRYVTATYAKEEPLTPLRKLFQSLRSRGKLNAGIYDEGALRTACKALEKLQWPPK